ncbi:MAG: hypothetical protein L0Y54_16415 [Sporichthyaceae bacterium]|nr:hypothetical protein [Sporichthyaceae bacterium]
MTWPGPTAYPGLGFDPLPGDPAVAERLAAEARRFAGEFDEAAVRLSRLVSPYGWRGEAAEAFADNLRTLPGDLAVCAESCHGLARELDRFGGMFVAALARAHLRDQRASAARTALRAAELRPRPAGSVALDPAVVAAQHELAGILRAARQLRPDLEVELRPVARAIRDLARHAPDEPRWHQLGRLAGAVLAATPLGAVVGAVHELVNDFPEFFDDLSEVLGTLSSVLGLAAALTFWLPGVGSSLSVLALATSAGSSLIKTSLYVGSAKDAHGRRYVDGAELARSWLGTAVAGVGPAVGTASAVRAGTRFGPALAGQLTVSGPTQLRYQTRAVAELIRDRGLLGAATQVGRTESMSWRAMDAAQRTGYLVSRSADGLGLPSAFGVTRLPGQLTNLVTNDPDTPRLRVGRPARVTATGRSAG